LEFGEQKNKNKNLERGGGKIIIFKKFIRAFKKLLEKQGSP
jgi:hypothetical protein